MTGTGGELLSNVVALVRHALLPTLTLVPYRDELRARYRQWLAARDPDGTVVTRYPPPMSETREPSDLDLPISERIQLDEDIRDGIADETAGGLLLAADQRAELHCRRAEHEADPSSAVPWEQVRAELSDSQRRSTR